MDQYPYSTLLNSDQIRLVTIHPGRFEDDILLTFDIVTFPSENCPPYDALSYTWDTRPDQRTAYVAVEDKIHDMSISCNLADALLHLRYADRIRVMWIDALCIDQTNDVEKGMQVAKMGKVYQSACRVCVWLGTEENDSNRALNTLLWIGSKVTVDWVRLSVALRPECIEPGFQDVNAGVPLRPEDTKAIYHLFCRRWFERLWIWQEVFLAEAKAVVQCGLYQIPWLPFRRALVCIYQKPRPWSPFVDRLNSRMLLLRGLMGQASTVPLGYIRAAFGQSDCADPRDRIYALLEFLPDGDRAVVGPPDYTKNAEMIFRDIVWRHINHYGSIDILSQCQIGSIWASDISWIPDWTKKELIFGRNYWRGFASSQLGAICTLSADKRELRTPGVSITKVRDLKDIPDMDGSHIDEEVRETLRLLAPSDELEREYVTGVSMLEAYARIFVANALKENQEPWLGEDPTLAEAQNIILDAQEQQEKYHGPEKDLSGHTREVFKIIRAMLAGRKLMHGSGGYIGTVPPPTRQGDEICILLGCHTPMVLRRVEDHIFRIFGECYVLGISEGEALLGPLPDETRRQFALDPKWGVYSTFVNGFTGQTSTIDPRLSSSLDLKNFEERLAKNPNAKLELEPEQLYKVFPQMQEFNII